MTRGSATAVTMASCTRVETLARRAPARAAWKVASPRRTRAAMTPVVAVPETNPPARPATMSPRLAPSKRVATYPSQLMPVMSTTSSQMRCGTQTPYGPKLPSGRTGSRTKAATKNLRASTCSRWVTVSLTNRCNASRETRSTVMTTASATARVGWDVASAPRPSTVTAATSLVSPGSRAADQTCAATIRRTVAATRPAATTGSTSVAARRPAPRAPWSGAPDCHRRAWNAHARLRSGDRWRARPRRTARSRGRPCQQRSVST